MTGRSDKPTGRAWLRAARWLQAIVLVCSALLLGLTLTHVLQSPGSRSLSGSQWLAVQHTFYGGFAMVGAVCEILGLLVAVALAILLRRRDRWNMAAAIIAALCFLGTLLSYWFGNRPVNTKVAEWTTATLPPDWTGYRATWETAHAVSTILAAIAFLVLLIAAIWRPISGAR